MAPRHLFSILALFGAALSMFVRQDTTQCKAFPGTSSWPSSATWDQLNSTVSGRLIRPLPPGGVCHEDQPNYSEAKCASAQEAWVGFDLHINDPVSVMMDNLSNWTCQPDPELPCSDAAYPVYVINATTAEHVRAGIDFARENNVRLNIRSTGHDFLGRSISPGSLSIWVHHFDSIEFHDDEFQLAGSDTVISGGAVTVGGGATMYNLYKATDKRGSVVVGGGCRTVSVGGFVPGGGHGLLTTDFGLAADNVLQVEVVTPDGEILIANEDQNSDLFWAIRGGGGGTFGVMISVTMKTHPSPTIQSVDFFLGTAPDAPNAREVLGWILSQVPDLMDAGLRGYNWVSPNGPVPITVEGIPKTLAAMSGEMVLTNSSPEVAEALMADLVGNLTAKFNGTYSYYDVNSWDSWLHWYDEYDNGLAAGDSLVLKSGLISRKALTEDPDAMADAMYQACEPSGDGGMLFFALGGKGVVDAKPRGGSNSVNPGWRSAYVHGLMGMEVPQFDRSAEVELAKTLDAAWESMEQLNPGLGAYLNEASSYEKNYQKVFWGDNYERLLEIKRQADPTDVFWCSPCVGDERWEQRDNGQLCKV